MRYSRMIGIPAILMLVFTWSGLCASGPFTFKLNRSQSSSNGQIIPLDNTGNWSYLDSDNTWKTLTLPFFFLHKSYLKVQCEFTLDNDDLNSPVHLMSDGFGCSVMIHLNEKLIYTQVNDFIPFSFELPRHYLTSDSKNVLLFELRVPESTDQGYPSFVQLEREPSYVGITRELKLIKNPTDWVDGFTCQVDDIKEEVTLNYAYNLRFRADNAEFIRIEERFFDDQNHLLYRRAFRFNPGTNPVTNQISIPSGNLWSPETPKRLRAVILRLNQENQALALKSFDFGARHLEVSGTELFLNKHKLTLKGITYYENLLRFSGQDFYELVKEDLDILKQSGINAIRFPHYSPSPFIISLADSMGFLLFAEIPVWRYPASLYKSDRLLENAKGTITNFGKQYRLSPSLTGLSLGQQIPLHEATTQKFMLILKRLAESNADLLTYLSPISGAALPEEASAEFYMIDSFRSLADRSPPDLPFCAAGNIGIMYLLPKANRLSDLSAIQIQRLLRSEIETVLNKSGMSGGFVNSFMDYYTSLRSQSTVQKNDYPVLPTGLFDIDRQAKFWSKDLVSSLWQGENLNSISTGLPVKQNNIFSIIIFFATILFFSYYKQNARFRENMKRSLRHPYGFFVDMRERRIIPLLNSIIAGGYYSLVLAIFVASLLVFHNDSLYLQEIISSLFSHTPLYDYFLRISPSPYYSIELMYALFITYPLLLSIALKFFSLFSKHRIRFRQGLAIGFWSGAPFVFMAPFAFVEFHVLNNTDYPRYLLYIFLFFILWAHFRIINGVRVLFITKARKVFLILLLSYCVPLIIFWAILKPGPHWWEYLKLLLSSHALY